MARRSMDITFVLALLVGAFLILDGVDGLIAADSFVGRTIRSLGAQGSSLNLVIAVAEIVVGALLVLGLFLDIGQLRTALGLVIFVGWLAVIVLTFAVRNLAPDTLDWWIGLIQYLIILAVIWMVKGRRLS